MKDEVAIKVVELEWLQAPLEDIGREIQVMSLSSHPNVVPFSTAFVEGTDLWIVMPLLTGGSVLSLMNCAYREGLPEEYARYILWCILKALEYFHGNGQMHRDVKAANLLLDSTGNTMLADYGMMGWMVEGGWDRKQRQTFVGTPCWMAPEVMEQTDGYDYKADVWSLGITAIELAQGRAPYINYPPMKVLFLTLQNPPPTISSPADQRFSATYKDFIASCLQKDPKVRPSAKQLLKHPLFAKGVTKPPTLADIVAKLPPIGSRGGSQKQLFRQLQKVAAPQRSGIFDKSSKGFGWDYSDIPDKPEPHQSAESVTAIESNATSVTPQASPPDSSSASVSSDAPTPVSATGNHSATDLPRERSAAISPLDTGLVPESSSEPNLAAHTASASPVSGGMHERAASMPVIPPQPTAKSSTAGTSTSALPDHVSIVGNQANSSWISSVPAKTVGQLRKGRFTVSDVPNPDRLEGKIENFLDEEASGLTPSQPAARKDEGRTIARPLSESAVLSQNILERPLSLPEAQQQSIMHASKSQSLQPAATMAPVYSAQGKGPVSRPSIPPSPLPQAVVDSKPRTSGGRQSTNHPVPTVQPRIVSVPNSAPSYAAAVTGQPSQERSFISGVAPVTIQPSPSRISEVSSESAMASRTMRNSPTPSTRPASSQGMAQTRVTNMQAASDPTRPPATSAPVPIVIHTVPATHSAAAGGQRMSGSAEIRQNGSAVHPTPTSEQSIGHYAVPTSTSLSTTTHTTVVTAVGVPANAVVSRPSSALHAPSQPLAVAPTASSGVQVTTIPPKSVTNSSQNHSHSNPPQPSSVQIQTIPVSTGTTPTTQTALPKSAITAPATQGGVAVGTITTPVQQGASVNVAHVAPPSTATVAPKRKSRFEVKDVERPAPGGKQGPPNSMATATSVDSMTSLGAGTLPRPSAGVGTPTVTKTKSRFEVKDIDQRTRQPPIPNGAPSIVSIGPPSSSSSMAGSRQGTPLVSPQPEQVQSTTVGAAKLSLSLLGELQQTIQALVNENESLRREVAMLRGKTHTIPPSGSVAGHRGMAAPEINK